MQAFSGFLNQLNNIVWGMPMIVGSWAVAPLPGNYR